MPSTWMGYACMRLLKLVISIFSVMAVMGAMVALGTGGEALAATASPGSLAYGPPAPPVAVPPGGFTAVVTSVSIGPAGGTIGPVLVDGAELTITIPAGAFPETVQITVTAPDLAGIAPLAGYGDMTGAGILVTLNGAPYPGTFLKPVTATFASAGITAASVVLVWNGTAFVVDANSAATAGHEAVSFDSDPDFAVESPLTTAVTKVPAATTPVTGKPLLGEGILAGLLVLLGTGGVVLSRRRRVRALPAAGERHMHGSGTRSGVPGIILGALAAATLTACSAAGAGQPAQSAASKPRQILAAPKELLSAGQPQPNGTLWALAGDAASKGLFAINLASGSRVGSISVSNAARSVTESLAGVVGLALGKGRTGALELLNGSTGKVIRAIPLGAPARDVVAGSDGATFYVLDGSSRSASVTVVNSRNGVVQGTIPVPLATVSVAPDAQDSSLYALQPNGLISQIAIAGGKIMSSFPVGSAARSLALSPDGGILYVLKDAGPGTNVAEVNVATESVGRVLPAPLNCLQVLVSADGSEIYQVVGTAAYGNIQVFPS